MVQRKRRPICCRPFVGKQDIEGRARHLTFRNAQSPRNSLHELGFSRTEVTRKQHDIATLQQRSQCRSHLFCLFSRFAPAKHLCIHSAVLYPFPPTVLANLNGLPWKRPPNASV